jgi:hypothetical protein
MIQSGQPRGTAATLSHGMARRGRVDGDHRRSTVPAPASSEDQSGHGGDLQSAVDQDRGKCRGQYERPLRLDGRIYYGHAESHRISFNWHCNSVRDSADRLDSALVTGLVDGLLGGLLDSLLG